MDPEFHEKRQQDSERTGKPIRQPPRANNADLYPAVPEALKTRPQWVVWRYEIRDGKPTKVPYQINGTSETHPTRRSRRGGFGMAKSNDPTTWTDYPSVCRVRLKWDGIGFVFAVSDPYCGIDLDDCLKDGKIKPWAQPIVDRLQTVSYGEVSPSGNGIKFWTRATLSPDAKHKVYITAEGSISPQSTDTDGAIEAYDKTRFFTVTGNGKGDIHNGQAVLEWLTQTYLKTDNTKPATPPPAVKENRSVDEVIALIRKSKQVHKFDALLRGDTTGYGSNSEADIALCAVIAFWTQDANIIDAIFRQSQLYRYKWDEKHRADGATYGQMTIEKALAGQTQTYKPHPKKRRRRQKRRTHNWLS